ncbi:MAG: hypothetical protein WCZ12_01685 [Patescibacteria group bacterium]
MSEKTKKTNKAENKTKKEKKYIKLDYSKAFFGLLIILLGVLLLGNNFGFWYFKINPALIFPTILIISGVFIMDNETIFKIFTLTTTIVVVTLCFLTLFCFTRNNLYNTMTQNKENMTVKIKEVYGINFQGSLSREEAETRIDNILDHIYKANPGERLRLEFNLHRR